MSSTMKSIKSKLVIITGLSGSGKSIALHALEDLGFFCIDNLSPNMILNMLETVAKSKESIYEKVAVSIDIRAIKMENNYKDSIDTLYNKLSLLDLDITTIFLHSSYKVLLSRFNATRRRHPLSTSKVNLDIAIKKEAEIMIHLKENSNLIIDTDNLLPLDLKKQISSKISIIRNVCKSNRKFFSHVKYYRC